MIEVFTRRYIVFSSNELITDETDITDPNGK